MKCGYCFAKTAAGELCKRLATCKLGCKFYCYQHAQKYGGKYVKKSVCNDNIPSCLSEPRRFPCSIKRTLFMTQREWNNQKIRRKNKKVVADIIKQVISAVTPTLKRKKSTKKVRFAV